MSTAKRTTTTKRAAVPAASPAPGVVDLSAIEASIRRQDEGIVVDIMGPDGKTPLGLRIRVAGPDSARAVAAQDALTDELLAAQNDGKPTAATYSARRVRWLAKLTLSWEGKVRFDGAEHEFSEAAAAALYERFPFVLNQIDRAAGDRSRFTNG
ncbi:MAG: hypothetical protein RL477_604 [Pseudomonadota bacterium]|jgi:hypothetical protein